MAPRRIIESILDPLRVADYSLHTRVVLRPSATATTLYFALLSAPYLLFMFIGVAFNFLYRGKLQPPLLVSPCSE